ncbi:MAG: hypothetical protein ABJH05_10490 [Fulvivirga sp.]
MKRLFIISAFIIGFHQGVIGQELPQSSFNINPLGLLQFGPIFQYEGKVGGQTYLVPYFRYAYAGLVTHAVWTEFDENSELSPGTFALGLGVKSFAQNEGNSIYYGAFLDFSRTKVNYSVGFSDETEEISTDLGVVPNFGYRWRSDRKIYFSLGLYSGLVFTLKDEERYVSDNELFASYSETTFFAMLEFSIGWE